MVTLCLEVMPSLSTDGLRPHLALVVLSAALDAASSRLHV